MGVRVKLDQFCALSSSAKWQAWLFRYDVALYNELADHLRSGRGGCKGNRDKMIELIGKIDSSPGGSLQLETFLAQEYPFILEKSTDLAPVVQSVPRPVVQSIPRPVVQSVPASVISVSRSVPFELRDRHVLTFPHRRIFEGRDSVALHREVIEFLRDKARADYVLIGDRAYVEYVPKEHAGIAYKIPIKNWLVTKWKNDGAIT